MYPNNNYDEQGLAAHAEDISTAGSQPLQNQYNLHPFTSILLLMGLVKWNYSDSSVHNSSLLVSKI